MSDNSPHPALLAIVGVGCYTIGYLIGSTDCRGVSPVSHLWNWIKTTREHAQKTEQTPSLTPMDVPIIEELKTTLEQGKNQRAADAYAVANDIMKIVLAAVKAAPTKDTWCIELPKTSQPIPSPGQDRLRELMQAAGLTYCIMRCGSLRIDRRT